jgi:hypothetical protein
MKNAKSFLGSFVLTALLFSSLNTEARSNYSNKAIAPEDKLKAAEGLPFFPLASVEEAPTFSAQPALSSIDRFSPEQLNQLMGVWPVRTETVSKPSKSVEVLVAPAEATPHSYSPQQLAELLGLNF